MSDGLGVGENGELRRSVSEISAIGMSSTRLEGEDAADYPHSSGPGAGKGGGEDA